MVGRRPPGAAFYLHLSPQQRIKLRIEKTLAFQTRASQAETPSHSHGKTSGCFRSRGVRAWAGHKVLPRRPFVAFFAGAETNTRNYAALNSLTISCHVFFASPQGDRGDRTLAITRA
jgi:hypothetical protein